MKATITQPPARHSIRLTGPNGAHAYLSHRGNTAFAPATARKYLAQWLAANPGGVARIENQFLEPVPSAAHLESRARRLYALRLVDPRAPHYTLADSLMDRARMVRACGGAKPAPLFKATWKQGRKVCESPVEVSASLAASHIPANSKGPATVLKDQQGADHPANAGKFFLHLIIR